MVIDKKSFNTAINNALYTGGNERFLYLADLVLIIDDNCKLAHTLSKQVRTLVENSNKKGIDVNPAWLPINAALDYVLNHKENVDPFLIEKVEQEKNCIERS